MFAVWWALLSNDREAAVLKLRDATVCSVLGTPAPQSAPSLQSFALKPHITSQPHPPFFFFWTRGRATVIIFSIPLFFLELLSRTVAMANMTGQTVTIDRAYFETILRR